MFIHKVWFLIKDFVPAMYIFLNRRTRHVSSAATFSQKLANKIHVKNVFKNIKDVKAWGVLLHISVIDSFAKIKSRRKM